MTDAPLPVRRHFCGVAFDGSVIEMYPPLMSGGTLLLRSVDIAASLARHPEVTHMLAVPSALSVIDPACATGLRTLSVGGEAVPKYFLKTWAAANRKIWNVYGPTETSVCSHKNLLSADDNLILVGGPNPNYFCYVLDENLRRLPTGAVGDLWIGGVGVARGYLNRPEKTAAAFRPNPFHPSQATGGRMYNSGDKARWKPNGKIQVLGRADGQVKIRGLRIEQVFKQTRFASFALPPPYLTSFSLPPARRTIRLGEIEAQLREQDGVGAAAVIVREETKGAKYLAAYLTPKGIDVDALITKVSINLAAYMVPQAVVLMDALPITANGKLDIKALPKPERMLVVGGEQEYVAPASESEKTVTEVFASMLGLEKVGMHDDFVQLGGNSLLLIRLASRISKTFDVKINVSDAMRAKTPAGFVELLGLADSTPRVAITRSHLRDAADGDTFVTSAQQHALWVTEQMSGSNSKATYNIPFTIRIGGDLANSDAVARAIKQLVANEEVLRTVIKESTRGDGSVQKVVGVEEAWEHTVVACAVSDFSGLPTMEEREAAARAFVQQDAQRGFDIARGVFRSAVLKLSDTSVVAYFNVHHVAFDGASLAPFGIRLLELLKSDYSEQCGAPKLPPHAHVLQYADYAEWKQATFTDEIKAKELQFYREALEGAPTLLEIQTTFKRPTEITTRGGTLLEKLEAPIVAQLERFVASSDGNITLFSTLISAFGATLAVHAQQTDVVIGTLSANRPEDELESMLGYFVNASVFCIL